MIAVILVPWPSPAMYGLDAEQSLSLLPLGDRPILQHIIESLVGQGIKSIELITGHAPEKIEALLGNGDRWGCSFRFHLALDRDRPYRSIKVIDRLRGEPWVLIHADRYPCVTFSPESTANLTLYCQSREMDHQEPSLANRSVGCAIDDWGGTLVSPAGTLGEDLWNKTYDELATYLQLAVSTGAASTVGIPEWIDVTTPRALLETQANLLSRKLNGLMISGIERQPGVWISRNVDIHPTAELFAPLYLGPNCRIGRRVRLGPDVVVSGGCIIDSNTIMDHSLTMAGSYVGESLELSQTIVDHELLVNVRLGTKVNISESFLLGGLRSHSRPGWIWVSAQSILAAMLILLLTPIFLLSATYFGIVRRIYYVSVQMARVPFQPGTRAMATYSLPCLGADAWTVHRPAGWTAFARQFLAGLFAVVAGRVGLVGLPPRTTSDIERLSEEWRVLYLRGRAGLITEASIAVTDNDQVQLYLADAYYCARQTWLHDIRIASQYFLRLIIPARSAD